MARLISPPVPPARTQGGWALEQEVLHRLELGLPTAYTVLHGVSWAQVHDERERHGELDVVVVNATGDVLLVEVKAGEVEFGAEGIFKRYGQQRHAVHAQVRLQYAAMRTRLDQAGLVVQVGAMLVVPHACVTREVAQWPRERIVDASQYDDLVHWVRQALPVGPAAPARQAQVVAFFANLLHLEPDVSALACQLGQATAQLAGGLATWVPRLEVPGGLLRVVGTAGSGKTQLAVQQLRQADGRGQRAAYLCFNRPLADHMARLLPPRVVAQTFHELAERHYRADHGVPDFTTAGIFDRLEAHAIDWLMTGEPDLDLLVIDEMQDFKPAWVQALLARLRESGCALLLEDPEQSLYGDREPFDIAGEVRLSAPENYRSPRTVVDLVNALRLTNVPVIAAGARQGSFQEPRYYASAAELQSATVTAVETCLRQGFALADVVVLSLHGLGRSQLLTLDRLGPWRLRRPTGRYGADGQPIWTDGDLMADTVLRFKGQSAPAVVLTEIDFAEFTDVMRRRLFVGLTRALIHWEWVLALPTARMIAQRLERTG